LDATTLTNILQKYQQTGAIQGLGLDLTKLQNATQKYSVQNATGGLQTIIEKEEPPQSQPSSNNKKLPAPGNLSGSIMRV
jgi:hypothetical protein